MLFHFIKKEFLLISRDIHTLLVLFIMPLVFIIIMSFALKNNFSGTLDTKYKVAVFSEKKQQNLNSSFFEFTFLDQNLSTKTLLYEKKYDFVLFIPQQIEDKNISMFTKSGISFQYVNMLKSEVLRILQNSILENVLAQTNMQNTNNFNITNNFLGKNGLIANINSVDQSVPSWLIFSMFFILIPISNAFINEKNFGTFSRLKSMNVSPWLILTGKFIPYFVVNQIQVLVMFLAGFYIMPILGLESLHVRGSFGLIFLISIAISFGAISFGLVIANIAKSSEEATTIGGVSNIILAAIGGIMVPKFVMPKIMQDISEISPMSWALDSFLDIIVRGGNLNDISGFLAKLLLFAILCLCVAYLLLKQKDH